MLSVEVINVSAIKTPTAIVNLPDTTATQSYTMFAGGCTLGYIDILTDLTDIKLKKFTNFYLTPGITLDSFVNTPTKSLSVGVLNTSLKSIRSGETVIPIDVTADNHGSTDIKLTLSDNTQALNNTFNITFIDKETCKVLYTTANSKRYMVVNPSKEVVLRKASSVQNNDNVLNYILNDDKLILYKQLSGSMYTFLADKQSVKAVEYTSSLFRNIKESAFIVNPITVVNLPSFFTSDYVTYTDASLNVDNQKSIGDIPINYLLSRTSYNDGGLNIISLKNYAAENGKYGRFNTLALSGADSKVLNRVYTSINNNIDLLEDSSLSLNYVYYNQAYNIYPGTNNIVTSETMYPFERLNINDTTFVDCGAYGASSPVYSDKIYYEVVNNRNEHIRYLCTWLYRDNLTNEYMWLDRYYYPNLISKSESLTNPIYNPTYDNYIESAIQANIGGKFNELSATQYFDKKSDLYFEPSKTYVYDRINLDTVNFISESNSFDAAPGYFEKINDNHGFTLAFRLNPYTDTSFITIQSEFNNVPGGIDINFNDNTINISLKMFSTVIQNTEYKYSGKLGKQTSSSVIVHVDILQGVIMMLIDNVKVLNEFFTPLLFPNALYGDIRVAGEPLGLGFNYIDDIFLSTRPLSIDEIEILRTKYNTYNTNLTISLPCGMRNRIDSISQIQSLHATSISKSNAFDINIDNLSLTDSQRDELQKVIEVELNGLLPVNSQINNIKIT